MGWVVARRIHLPIAIAPHSVVTEGLVDDVFDRMRSQFQSNPNVVITDGDRILARFAGRAGPFAFQTAEVISFGDRHITFEHVGGTFLACQETFAFRPEDDGHTRIEHSGSFTMRGGLPGWLLGVVMVRRLFRTHVTDAMQHSAATTP